MCLFNDQLYVAVLRVKTRGGLKILITNDNDKPKNSTVNVVYAWLSKTSLLVIKNENLGSSHRYVTL
jgi:hypothetical protein